MMHFRPLFSFYSFSVIYCVCEVWTIAILPQFYHHHPLSTTAVIWIVFILPKRFSVFLLLSNCLWCKLHRKEKEGERHLIKEAVDRLIKDIDSMLTMPLPIDEAPWTAHTHIVWGLFHSIEHRHTKTLNFIWHNNNNSSRAEAVYRKVKLFSSNDRPLAWV